jgi:hypothetical protein
VQTVKEILRYWPLLRDLIRAIRELGADPAVELRNVTESYAARARAEAAWNKAQAEKFRR